MREGVWIPSIGSEFQRHRCGHNFADSHALTVSLGSTINWQAGFARASGRHIAERFKSMKLSHMRGKGSVFFLVLLLCNLQLFAVGVYGLEATPQQEGATPAQAQEKQSPGQSVVATSPSEGGDIPGAEVPNLCRGSPFRINRRSFPGKGFDWPCCERNFPIIPR